MEEGPTNLLEPDLTLATLLCEGPGGVLEAAARRDDSGVVPDGARVVAPVCEQPIWAAGVTYGASREARIEEAQEADIYDRVWGAERPELFLKAEPWRVQGPGEPIGVRPDSAWNAPEPELALVLTPEMRVAGYTIGNDVTARSIEAENPLYLPQAKHFEHSCSLGPAIVPAGAVSPPFTIRLAIRREGELLVDLRSSTSEMVRSFDELAAHLGRALSFPTGAVLLTGTSLVPAAPYTLEPGDEVTVSIEGLGELANVAIRLEPGAAAAGGSGAGR